MKSCVLGHSADVAVIRPQRGDEQVSTSQLSGLLFLQENLLKKALSESQS